MKPIAMQTVLVVGCFAVMSGGFSLAKHVAAQQTIAYTGATLETLGPEGRLENATIVTRDGKILDVGAQIQIPENAQRVSLQGKTVLPALIDPYFVYLRPSTPQPTIPAQFRGRFRGRGTTRFTVGPFTRVAEFFYPYQSDFKPALRSGIATANLVVDGQGHSAIAHLGPKPSEEMIFQADGVVFTKVTNQTSALDTIRNGLDPSRASRGSRGRFGGARGGRSRGASPQGDQGDQENQEQASQVDDDETKKLWSEIREGKRPLMVNVNNSATIAHLMKLLESYDKVRLFLVSTGPNLYPVLEDLKNPQVTLVLQPSIDRVPYTDDRMNVPKMVHDMQIPFALSMSVNQSQLNSAQDDPMFALAYLVKTGLPREAALKALTIEPAKMLGISETHGTLEKGKVANLLVFDGDPLDTTGRLEQVISQGRTVHEN